MQMISEGHSFGYEMQRLAAAFFPGRPVSPQADGDGALVTWVRPQGPDLELGARLEDTGAHLCRRVEGGAALPAAEQELALGRVLYDFLQGQTGAGLPWGILTGVRPMKLFHQAQARGMDQEGMARFFAERYRISPQRIRLAQETLRQQEGALARCNRKGFSLYISIPFCPGRCSYCSFVSHSVKQAARLMAPYVECLCRELEAIGAQARRLGMRPQTVYWGGGTPTTLSAGQLTQVLQAVQKHFDLDGVEEYTVEAGRPDTIDPEKLRALHMGGATRLSVNPQTFNDQVLARVGRAHSGEDIERAFGQARQAGFANINMDLIAGLPGERLESFCRSMDRVLALGPEGVTIHTLALKRAADLAQGGGALLQDAREAACMVEEGRRLLQQAGYAPYYLYRQDHMVANLENVGYARPGFEGLYNIYMMEETQSVFSAGAGGVTRLCGPDGQRLVRIFNYKYPYEYINRFEQLLQRKEGVQKFYENGV